MYIYVCVYICTYIYIHSCIYIYIYMYTYIHIYTYIYIYIYIYLYVYTHTHHAAARSSACIQNEQFFMCVNTTDDNTQEGTAIVTEGGVEEGGGCLDDAVSQRWCLQVCRVREFYACRTMQFSHERVSRSHT